MLVSSAVISRVAVPLNFPAISYCELTHMYSTALLLCPLRYLWFGLSDGPGLDTLRFEFPHVLPSP